ncbi:hypothetical protein B0T25DRAFT_553015 [Lasiosphaeria hispida]|uniref:Uncharacterized protein n=1 Tax=Lasiosphaeria hispida TaxID=260671 RepID=A0AAJ0HC36_9PEZI|nr:hypothetical protein B0T25DRAFT_553015 [Lasiosphaeria hispida]
MVISQVQQPDSSFMLLERFMFPDNNRGAVDAVAVSAESGRHIASAYTIMSTMTVVHIWGIMIATGFYFYLRNPKNKVSDISVSLWNKRAATQQSIQDVLLYAREDLKKWWYYPLLMGIIAAWAAGIVAGIFVPSKLFLGNAAPVNAASIYAPILSSADNITAFIDLFALDVQPYLRATGAALIANETLRGKVSVGQPIILGEHTNQTIQRIDYGYVVTGAEMGLQHLPHLQLAANGSCVTEYSWWQKTEQLNTSGLQDTYRSPFGPRLYSVSALDGSAPSAQFVIQNPPPARNISWGIILSSVDRLSATESDDPWYQTIPYEGMFKVQPARPALSCWQDDVWTYSGMPASVRELEKIVPSELLSEHMVRLLARTLRLPVVYRLGSHLGTTALESATAPIGSTFNAGGSSIHKDLERLVLSSYIATVNTLTDTTLYLRPEGETPSITNIALDSQSQPLPGVDAFVVYTSKATALSVTTLIVVPTLALGTLVLSLLLLKFSPLRLATAMEVIEHFQLLREDYGDATIKRGSDGKSHWEYDNMPPPPPKSEATNIT